MQKQKTNTPIICFNKWFSINKRGFEFAQILGIQALANLMSNVQYPTST